MKDDSIVFNASICLLNAKVQTRVTRASAPMASPVRSGTHGKWKTSMDGYEFVNVCSVRDEADERQCFKSFILALFSCKNSFKAFYGT